MEKVTIEVPSRLMKAVRTLCNQYNEPVNEYLVRGIRCELEGDLTDGLDIFTSEPRKNLVNQLRCILEGHESEQASCVSKESNRDE
jgi:hypothetical protein